MKLIQKKSFVFFLLISILLTLHTTSVFAEEDSIPSIYIDVNLRKDGSAFITETWEVHGISSGTEYYKSLNNMSSMDVHSFMVVDESGNVFKTLDNWDINLSLEEKFGTCGILYTKNGYELCWGIGSYGNHIYTISYVLEGLVKSYEDYAGFYHQFISELSSPPRFVSIEISLEDGQLTKNNSSMWGYGYTGDISVGDNSKLMTKTISPLENKDYINLLCRFDNSLFPLSSYENTSFTKLQKMADDTSSNTAIFIVLACIAILIPLTLALISRSSQFKLSDGTIRKLPRLTKSDINMRIPFGSNIPAIYVAMALLRRKIPLNHLLSCYLISWQHAGYINIEEREKSSNGKKIKREKVIAFNQKNIPNNDIELSLYNILRNLATEDGLLWNSTITNQAEKIYKLLIKWEKEVTNEGNSELKRIYVASNNSKDTLCFTEIGFNQAVNLLRFQNYLIQMQKHGGEGITQTHLWGDYFMFGALFGIGNHVLKSLESLNPSQFETFSHSYHCNSHDMLYLMMITNQISNSSVPNTGNSSGTGGFSSPSGGGGFSGGGGGGSR